MPGVLQEYVLAKLKFIVSSKIILNTSLIFINILLLSAFSTSPSLSFKVLSLPPQRLGAAKPPAIRPRVFPINVISSSLFSLAARNEAESVSD